jgi:hypothetical protein
MPPLRRFTYRISLLTPTLSPLFLSPAGALTFIMRNDEKSFGKANAIKFYAGVNFPATLYICRFEDDNALGTCTRVGAVNNLVWFAHVDEYEHPKSAYRHSMFYFIGEFPFIPLLF